MKSTELVPYDGGGTDVPLTAKPLMYAHLLLTLDTTQHATWKERLERLAQMSALESAGSREERTAIAHRGLWASVRRSSWWAAFYTTFLGSLLTADLIYEYAVGWNFGWLASSAYLLPVPIAWIVAKNLYQKGGFNVVASVGKSPTPSRWAGGIARSLGWSFASGFGFGFTMLFLQGLISYRFTPAATIPLELWADAVDGVLAGMILGGLSTLSCWMFWRKMPSEVPALPESTT